MATEEFYVYKAKLSTYPLYTVKYTVPPPLDMGTLHVGDTLSSGEKFTFDGTKYIYEGGADTASTNGQIVGFFAQIQGTSKTVFFSNNESAYTYKTKYVFNQSQSYTVVCFARGTRIATRHGEVAVETLGEGDLVATLVDGETVFQPVKWLGRRSIDLLAHRQPETVAPVLVQRGAFADNVPHRDLLLSPDHAVCVDGKLIAVRQLMNGTTIRQLHGRTEVEYFHVELEGHAILLAEGLPTESYLETGNRGFFANSDAPLVLHPDLMAATDVAAREAASCMPFVSAEADVRPVWEALARRAADQGLAVSTPDVETASGLCIVARGRTVRPIMVTNDVHTFVLPKGTTEVRVVSNAAMPADIRPWLDDRRRLGVSVERIVLRDGSGARDIAVDHPGLSDGWWAVEQNGATMRRWTDGDAVLPLPATDGQLVLEIQAVGNSTGYVADRKQLAA